MEDPNTEEEVEENIHLAAAAFIFDQQEKSYLDTRKYIRRTKERFYFLSIFSFLIIFALYRGNPMAYANWEIAIILLITSIPGAYSLYWNLPLPSAGFWASEIKKAYLGGIDNNNNTEQKLALSNLQMDLATKLEEKVKEMNKRYNNLERLRYIFTLLAIGPLTYSLYLFLCS